MLFRYRYLTRRSRQGDTDSVSLLERERLTENSCIIALEPQYTPQARRFHHFVDVYEFMKIWSRYTSETRPTYHSIILGPHKFYLDIDIEITANLATDFGPRIVEACRVGLCRIFPQLLDSDFIYTESCDDTKLSYHIIVDHWYCNSIRESRYVYELLLKELPEDYHAYIDCLYRNNQSLRVYGCPKHGTRRVKRWVQKSWEPPLIPDSDENLEVQRCIATLPGCILGCTQLTINVPEHVENHNVELSNDDVERCLRMLRQAQPDTGVLEFLGVYGNQLRFKRDTAFQSFCKACSRSHQHENPYIYVVGENRYVNYSCRREHKYKSAIVRLGLLGAAEESADSEEIPLTKIKYLGTENPEPVDYLAEIRTALGALRNYSTEVTHEEEIVPAVTENNELPAKRRVIDLSIPCKIVEYPIPAPRPVPIRETQLVSLESILSAAPEEPLAGLGMYQQMQAISRRRNRDALQEIKSSVKTKLAEKLWADAFDKIK